MTKALRVLLLAMFALTGGCWKKDAVVHIKVEAKTNQHDAVSAATVALDGQVLGKTGNDGKFEGETKLPVGARRRLEVKKDSDKYYFAPYFETFSVPDANPLELSVQAVLYFVPKPTPGADDKRPAPLADAPKVDTPPETVASVSAADQDLTAELDKIAMDPTPAATKDETAADLAAKADNVVAAKDKDLIAAKAPVETLDAATDAKPTDEFSAATTEMPGPVPKLELTPVAAALDYKTAVYPKPSWPNKGATLYTVHVFAGEQAIPDVQILLGQDEEGDLKVACTTNARGRCVVRFNDKPDGPVTFVAVRPGFKTKSVTATVADKQVLKIDLERGQTIDIFAVTRAYNYVTGLKDVEVFVNGKRAGATDRFGRYSHVYAGKPDDLITITLKSKGYLPETYETDFVASGPMKLVRPFTPDQPPSVRMAVLDVRPAGQIDQKAFAALQGAFNDELRSSARKHLFSSAAFQEYAPSLLERATKRIGRPVSEMLRAGWQDTDLKAAVDALLLPTVLPGAKPVIELSLIDSNGRVLAAAKEELDSLGDKASVDRAVAVVAKKITRVFPFEGAVLAKDADKVTINLGYGAGRGVKAGDVLEVYGVQTGKKGLSQDQQNIARLAVREVFDTTAKAQVTSLMPRATIERGDLVVLRSRRAPEPTGAQIRVSGNVKGIGTDPVAQANVYFNDQWIGATDDSGRLYIEATGTGTLKVIHHGFQDYAKPTTLTAQSRLDVQIRRETAFLRVDSKPQGVNVKIEGKVIGKTPLAAPIPVPAGFVKIELDAPSGFKPYSGVLELDQGTLDLTGPNAIQLERDLRAVAQRLLKEGKVDAALAAYDEIPKGHSDYLLGRHEAGEIYLTMREEPAKAAEAFGLVTADEAVKSFADKRFIGSHVDEGIALFETAEKLATEQPDAARAHYQKAIQVLEAVGPHLRFVAPEQYAQAVHNVDFHRALARHKLWLLNKDAGTLADTVKSWRTYLDGDARSLPTDAATKSYVENAQVYYRQAQASQSAAKSDVSKQ